MHDFSRVHVNRVFKKGATFAPVELETMDWDRFCDYLIERGWDQIAERRGVNFDSLSAEEQKRIDDIAQMAVIGVIGLLTESADPGKLLDYMLCVTSSSENEKQGEKVYG